MERNMKTPSGAEWRWWGWLRFFPKSWASDRLNEIGEREREREVRLSDWFSPNSFEGELSFWRDLELYSLNEPDDLMTINLFLSKTHPSHFSSAKVKSEMDFRGFGFWSDRGTEEMRRALSVTPLQKESKREERHWRWYNYELWLGPSLKWQFYWKLL